MKVQVIHNDLQRDGSVRSRLVATVDGLGPYYGLESDLEYAYQRTQNTIGSWSKDIGLPNPDGDRDFVTVEAPLLEVTTEDGSVQTLGHRSTMIGDILKVVDDGKERAFRVAFAGFEEIFESENN